MPSTTPASVCAFVQKFYKLLELPAAAPYIWWDKHGQSISFRHVPAFEKLLKKYFRLTKTPSLIRQLNSYHFYVINSTRRTSTKQERVSHFQHPFFQRGKKDLLYKISKTEIKDAVGANSDTTSSPRDDSSPLLNDDDHVPSSSSDSSSSSSSPPHTPFADYDVDAGDRFPALPSNEPPVLTSQTEYSNSSPYSAQSEYGGAHYCGGEEEDYYLPALSINADASYGGYTESSLGNTTFKLPSVRSLTSSYDDDEYYYSHYHHQQPQQPMYDDYSATTPFQSQGSYASYHHALVSPGASSSRSDEHDILHTPASKNTPFLFNPSDRTLISVSGVSPNDSDDLSARYGSTHM